MNVKRLLVTSAVWTVVMIGLGMGGVAYIMNHPIPGVSSDQRSAMLGQGVGTVVAIGWGFIWLPSAFRHGQKRRAGLARNQSRVKRRR